MLTVRDSVRQMSMLRESYYIMAIDNIKDTIFSRNVTSGQKK